MLAKEFLELCCEYHGIKGATVTEKTEHDSNDFRLEFPKDTPYVFIHKVIDNLGSYDDFTDDQPILEVTMNEIGFVE